MGNGMAAPIITFMCRPQTLGDFWKDGFLKADQLQQVVIAKALEETASLAAE